MAKLSGNKTLMIVLIVVVVLVVFLVYIIVPSGLPKPISIEFVSAESEPPSTETEPVMPKQPEPTEIPSQAEAWPQGLPVTYPKKGQGIMYDVGSQVVNLLDPVGRRYLKINIVLEFLPPNYEYYQLEDEQREAEREKFIAEIDQRKPIIDDVLISLLTSRSYEDIYTLAGKSQLRADIQDGLNEVLEEPLIVAVYFTEFLIQ